MRPDHGCLRCYRTASAFAQRPVCQRSEDRLGLRSWGLGGHGGGEDRWISGRRQATGDAGYLTESLSNIYPEVGHGKVDDVAADGQAEVIPEVLGLMDLE